MDPKEVDHSNLWSKEQPEYGENYHNHLFEQYKLFVGTCEKVTDRRASANQFFISVNAAITGLLSWVFSSFSDYHDLTVVLFSISGILLSLFWMNTIKSYRQLNTGKFAVLHQIEERLPARLFCYEWKILGEGKEQQKYKKLTNVEKSVPLLFIFLYLILVLIPLLKFFSFLLN